MSLEDGLMKKTQISAALDPVAVSGNTQEESGMIARDTEKNKINERDMELIGILNKEGVEREREDALKELIDRYYEKTFSLVLPIVRNSRDAEEIALDAFKKVNMKSKSFRGDSSFSTWLYRIAINLARNRILRENKVRKAERHVSFDAPLSEENDTTLADVVPSETKPPGDDIDLSDLSTEIVEKIKFLDPKHREILTLRILQNKSYAEISQTLGVDVGTVKSRIARARENLKNLLGSRFNEMFDKRKD